MNNNLQELNSFVNKFKFGCKKCSLSNDRSNPIIYRGNPQAKILLVGEGPGLVEEQEQLPFVGPAGKLLDTIMKSIELDTNKDMILTNSVFCRPAASFGSGKQNNTPEQKQLEACKEYLYSFIKIIQPKIIIACGRIALLQLTEKYDIKIGQYEGRWIDYKYTIPFPLPYKGMEVRSIPMFVMTHPAALIHKKAKCSEEDYIKTRDKVKSYMKEFQITYKRYLND
jgi:uracil-DNA glycosylase